MKTGIELIAEERQRQIEKYGYTAQHDLGYQEFISGGSISSFLATMKEN